MCFGPGSSWSPVQAATSDQLSHNLAISRARKKVNAIFDSPQRIAQANQLGQDTTSYYTDRLNQEKAQNDLRLKFALARGGQVGGSQQTYDAGLASKDYLHGILAAENRGVGARANLLSSDANSRARLLASIESGMSIGQGSNQATQALINNLQSERAQSTVPLLGDAFANMQNIYRQSRQAAADRQANRYLYNLLY